MARSMTGFGRATGTIGEETFAVEVSSVNHRHLECSFRTPGAWATLEPVLRDEVKRFLSRGKINLSIRRERGVYGQQTIHCNEVVAKQYIDTARQLGSMMSSTEALSLNTLVRMDGVFYTHEEVEDLDTVKAALCATVGAALEQLNAARVAEGKALADDIRERLAQMREALGTVEARIPELNTAYMERLRARVHELSAETGLTEERLALEVALMADKADVNEEVVRLKTHFEHVEEFLGSKDPIGRELNFLGQEIQREVNTLGSKLRDIGVTREVLRMKSELEKLKEQANNIE